MASEKLNIEIRCENRCMEVKKQLRIRREKSYSARGYLYIKAYNEYVQGVLGTDIKLTFKQKIKILFSKGITVCIGDVFKKRRTENA